MSKQLSAHRGAKNQFVDLGRFAVGIATLLAAVTVSQRAPVSAQAVAPRVVISEVHPGGSGNSTYKADWFEVTNVGFSPVDVAGWMVDDDSNAFATAVPLRVVTSIPVGKSAVFIQGSADGSPADLALIASFSTAWFGSATPPADVLIGTYGGANVGLSTGGDAVNLFDASGNRVTGVRFGSQATATATFDNTAGLGGQVLPLPAIATASAAGFNAAFTSLSGGEIGSPGVRVNSSPLAAVDLSTYVRVGRFALPAVAPGGGLLAREASAVTYDWDTDTLFVLGDHGASIVQVSKDGQLIDSMTLAAGAFADPEGLSYVGGGKFVLVEERERQAVLFAYTPGATLARSATQTVKLGTFVNNIGLEGISYDPLTGGFIAVKETEPQGIFQTGINFQAGTATNGSPTTENSINLFNPALAGLADFADVYALSNLRFLAGGPSSQLLVLSQESGKVVNIDRSGTIANSLTILFDPAGLAVAAQGHEGLAMDFNGNLYIASENGGGDIDHPQLWVYAPSQLPNQAPTSVSLSNRIDSIAENTSTATRLKMADIAIADDGLGTNNLTLTGADAMFFEIDGSGLYLKAGTVLDFETKSSYSVTIAVDDATVGGSPDATVNYTLTVLDAVEGNPGAASLVITEVSPWSSGNSPYMADWFEVRNTGTVPVTLTGWKMDDDSNAFGNAVALRGVASIPAGKSAVFFEGTATGSTDAAIIANFSTAWFGSATPPPGFLIGAYGGSGVGLGTGGDAVNLFDASGNRVTGVRFGASTTGFTFDNAAGLGSTTLPLPTVSTLSLVGVSGALLAADGLEIGSPGTIANSLSVTLSGYVRDRRTGFFVQQLTLTNTSSAAVSGPLFVALDNLSPSAPLANASGTTTIGSPLGSPYVLMPGSAGGLAVNASVTVVLQFSNPTNGAIKYTPRVLNGVTTP